MTEPMMDVQIALEHRAQVGAFQKKHRTGLLTLLFTDLVGSTKLKQDLEDLKAVSLIQRHHALVRQILGGFPEAQEISTAGDAFFIVFVKPSDAVKFSLLLQARLRAFSQEAGTPILDRIGIHIGEVVIEEHEDSTKTRDLYGIQVDIAARIQSLAEGNQVLMSRSAFDNARQVLKGQDLEGIAALSWLNHGPYLLKGVEELLEICEVGEVEQAPLKPPADSEKAHRHVSADSEPVLGWRPAVGQGVPNTKWVLEEKLGEGGFGEVWVARHEKLKERRVFKFCFRADRVRSLKREVTLFRVLKERVGEHPNIVKLEDVYFDQPPYYVEMEHVAGKDLARWAEGQGGLAKIPLATRLEIVAQMADALQAAHEAGIIHRDVKPSNILIHQGTRGPERNGKLEDRERRAEGDQSLLTSVPTKLVAKLTDFGIGQVVSQEALAGLTRAGFTQTLMASSSTQSGTHIYMAPELLAGKPASARSDTYSLGVVLYQMVIGDLNRPLATDWAKEISDPLLREDLEKCFAGNPQARFAGIGELANSLRTLPERQTARAKQEAEQIARERAAYRRGVLRTAAIFTVMTLIALVGVVVSIWQTKVARQAEAKMRKNASRSDFLIACEKADLGQLDVVLAYLGHALKIDSQNVAAQARLFTLLGQRHWACLQTVMTYKDIVRFAQFSPDGR